MPDPPPDQARADAFAQRMVDVLNSTAVALMASVGHRTGLFDSMAKRTASTSEELARAAGLDERYVREWLHAMVVGRIVEFDPRRGTYALPPEHAACLTRDAGPNNLSFFTQYFGVMGGVEDRIVECFQKGGGVPYSAFPRFHQIMAEESRLTVATALFDAILPIVPGLMEALDRGIDVLDVGCGSGHTLNLMAQKFPRSRFSGYDFSEEAIGNARTEAREMSVPNARFELRDAAALDEPGRFHLITAFDAIHDQAHPRKVLKGIAASLRPDGTFLMQDIAGSSHVEKNLDHPLAPLLYAVSTFHCMTVSLALGGEGLGTMWGEEKALELLAEAGFTRVEVKSLPHDAQNSYFVAKKG